MSRKEKQPLSYEGEVLWFNNDLNYGFISCKDFPKNIYVHYSRIVTDEKFKTLSPHQIVLFEVSETAKGLQAINVREKKIVKTNATIVQ